MARGIVQSIKLVTMKQRGGLNDPLKKMKELTMVKILLETRLRYTNCKLRYTNLRYAYELRNALTFSKLRVLVRLFCA